MELWLRYRKAKQLEWDELVSISSFKHWSNIINDQRLVSSVLWPKAPLFHMPGITFRRNHPHERDYRNEPARNESYREGCSRLAQRITDHWGNAKVLVYAPLRGALPIWQCISQFVDNKNISVYHPVTSSFIFYPEEFGIRNLKNKTASGRYNNRLELVRIKPFLSSFDVLMFIDEIVSGGMMRGYINDIIELGINEEIPVIAVGLADSFGERSTKNRNRIASVVKTGRIKDFYWEGCASLITEDQKFLLGIHYIDYHFGPHAVPVLNDSLRYYPEKIEFEEEVIKMGK
jgi:hypothetical protein